MDLSRFDKKSQGPLDLVSYWSFLVPLKPHTKPQLERSDKPTQLDNQLNIKGKTYKILKWFFLKIIVKWCVCVSEATQLFSLGN